MSITMKSIEHGIFQGPLKLLEYYNQLMEKWRDLWRDTHDGNSTGATEYALSWIALDILNGAQGNDLYVLNRKINACQDM